MPEPSQSFTIGLTRDFLDPQGRLAYRDVGLGLLDAEPNCRYRYLSEHRSPVEPEQIAELDASLVMMPRWSASTFARGAERLLVVARFGVGYDNCDVAALTANDVLLTIAAGATDHPVAGGALTMILALSRRLFVKDRLVREGRWAERSLFQGDEIAGKVLGIVGFGGSGRRLRELVAPFGMRVLVHDPYVPDEVLRERAVERAADLEELFTLSDYVSVHCLLTEGTRGLIHRELFRRMKPAAYFVNLSRGPVVREPDLIEALREGWIAGAGLDVFEQEPPAPDNPLLTMDNVVLAPHAISWTHDGFQAIGETAIRSILSVKHGKRPHGLVNPEVLDRPGFKRKTEALYNREATPPP